MFIVSSYFSDQYGLIQKKKKNNWFPRKWLIAIKKKSNFGYDHINYCFYAKMDQMHQMLLSAKRASFWIAFDFLIFLWFSGVFSRFLSFFFRFVLVCLFWPLLLLSREYPCVNLK